MFTFNGDFRRKPLQNMSGASRNNQRDALLQRAQAERQKREEQRRRQSSAALLQAFIRGCMTRAQQRRYQRTLFDQLVKDLGQTQCSDKIVLAALLGKLLFFYRQREDPLRLMWISQQLVRSQGEVLIWCCRGPEADCRTWRWRVRQLLHLCLLHLVHASPGESGSGAGRDSLAVPLRLLEVFTSWNSLTKPPILLTPDAAINHTCQIFIFLVQRGYFRHLRQLLDSRVPPMMAPSAEPPTPLAGCLLDMVMRPLLLTHKAPQPNYSRMVLSSFAEYILEPPLTEPVQLFVIPAFVAMADFPYTQLVSCLRTKNEPPSISLLYAFLALEKLTLGLDVQSWDSDTVLQYLDVLSWLTEQLASDRLTLMASDQGRENSDSEDEVVEMASANLNKQVTSECIAMLNDGVRVQRILQMLEKGPSLQLRLSLCKLCHNLLLSHKLGIHNFRLLFTLAFRASFLRDLWHSLMATTQASIFPGAAATPLVRVLARGLELEPHEIALLMPQLATFCSLFSLLLLTMHDSEFFGDAEMPGVVNGTMPFTLSELVALSSELKGVCLGLIRLAFPESRPSMREDYRSAVRPHTAPIATLQHGDDMHYSQPTTHTWGKLFKAAVDLLQQLHARDTRRPFCPKDHWIAQEVTLPASEIGANRLNLRRNYRPFRRLRLLRPVNLEEGPPLSTKEVRNMAVLQEMPFVISFEQRVQLFQALVMQEKGEHQADAAFLQGPSIRIMVRRNYLYEDAFEKLSPENEPELRTKLRVQLMNAAGLEEAGVDGGGLFREFLSELLKTAFDPNRGFFCMTKDNMLYPNPCVHLLHEDFPKHYFFIGRVLGKALFENLLVELPLAEFFLSKLVCGTSGSDVEMHQLASLDPVMYRSLLYLKGFDGDVAELNLDFTVLVDQLGETKVEELKPGGSNIPVCSANRIEYIHLIADYKLNKQIRAQCNAFKQGLADVIPLEWLQMFNNKEIQVLISGAPIPVDVTDLKEHSVYGGGYGPDHPTIVAFWIVLEEFTDLQRRQLLKFVTSCSRPPLLGFKELYPPFCVQHAGPPDRLPTASTCMNLLKLPEFRDRETLRTKLLYAIQSGSGFELS